MSTSRSEAATRTARALTGNQAVAEAARLARIGAGVFFPMGPADQVMEFVQELIDRRELKNAEVIQLENEKACVSCQIAMARLGVRTVFATCAEGMLWPASEIKYAAGSRLPILIACTSRAISPPSTIYCDHDDFIMQRDMGCLMFYCESAQDVLDSILQAYKVAEHSAVLLPAIVGYDGWDVSHSATAVSIPDQTTVDAFLPPRAIATSRDYLQTDWYSTFQERRYQKTSVEYMDSKYNMVQALSGAKVIIERVGAEYRDLFGSANTGLVDAYRCDDAELIAVTMGVLTATTRFVVDALRDKGKKVGSLKLRVFRPFPSEALLEALGPAKVVMTLERNSLAAMLSELKAAFYRKEGRRPIILGRVVGVGGRSVSYLDIARILDEALESLTKRKAIKELDWVPIKGQDFDPFEDDVGE